MLMRGMYVCLIATELQRTNTEYEDKLKSGGTKNSTKFALCWDMDELSRLTLSPSDFSANLNSTD